MKFKSIVSYVDYYLPELWDNKFLGFVVFLKKRVNYSLCPQWETGVQIIKLTKTVEVKTPRALCNSKSAKSQGASCGPWMPLQILLGAFGVQSVLSHFWAGPRTTWLLNPPASTCICHRHSSRPQSWFIYRYYVLE